MIDGAVTEQDLKKMAAILSVIRAIRRAVSTPLVSAKLYSDLSGKFVWYHTNKENDLFQFDLRDGRIDMFYDAACDWFFEGVYEKLEVKE